MLPQARLLSCYPGEQEGISKIQKKIKTKSLQNGKIINANLFPINTVIDLSNLSNYCYQYMRVSSLIVHTSPT